MSDPISGSAAPSVPRVCHNVGGPYSNQCQELGTPGPDASVRLRRSPPRHGACTRVGGMGGVIRCYRTTPRQLAIGGSLTTHRLQLPRPVARGGTNSGLCRPPQHGMRPHIQHGMKCAARGHERDATWKLGCLRVRYIPKAYTCTANTHPSRDAGPGRGPSGARFHGSRGGAVVRRDGRTGGGHDA